ncbi:MAG TPA: hypothetical protein DIW67_05350 [Pseudomonas sp.]|uniref:hypothetical protein n=1 Tax=Pseudomonas sp. TaxID=306 RepID=UPI000ECBB27A|nr:hypothetical protein [Pseudomonas sp.]HCS06548.1 hypothetical protein [Pseudomonas sp.]
MEYKLKVVSGQLIFLPDNLPVPFESDLACSQLFMQFYADGRADRFAELDSWDQHIGEARVQTKWITTLSQNVDVKPSKDAFFDVLSVISELINQPHTINSGVSLNLLRDGLKALTCDARPQKVFFDSVFKRSVSDLTLNDQGSLNVCFLLSVLNPKNQLLTVQVRLSVHGDPDANIFIRPLEGKELMGTPSLTVSSAELNTRMYEKVRGNINAFVKDIAVDQIVDLVIN